MGKSVKTPNCILQIDTRHLQGVSMTTEQAINAIRATMAYKTQKYDAIDTLMAGGKAEPIIVALQNLAQLQATDEWLNREQRMRRARLDLAKEDFRQARAALDLVQHEVEKKSQEILRQAEEISWAQREFQELLRALVQPQESPANHSRDSDVRVVEGGVVWEEATEDCFEVAEVEEVNLDDEIAKHAHARQNGQLPVVVPPLVTPSPDVRP